MKDKRKNKKSESASGISINPDAKEGKDQFLEHWKDGNHKNMGNDIESEIKIANSQGADEGGKDKRWHMDEEHQQ